MVFFLETFQMVLRRFESANIPYMIVGSLASSFYGEPRLTRDMDLVVDIALQDARRLEQLFPQPDFYCPPFEVLNDEILNRGQFNLLHPATGLKVDVMIKNNSAFDNSRFSRRQRLELWEGFSAHFATPEDVIIKKLEYYREGQSEKHLRDIRGILTNSTIDRDYLSKWIASLHLDNEWKLIES